MEHITRKSHDADADSGSQHVLTILDSFEHDGEQGKHVCLVLKPMGPVVSEYRWLFPQKRIPVPIVKRITRQVLEALVFLHDQCGVIHTGVSSPIPLAISACLRFQTGKVLTRTM
jgi:serine/threonine-protein kinase SRPK3